MSLFLVLLLCSLVATQPCAVFFVSSSVSTGDLGGVGAADVRCASLFRANGLAAYKSAQQAAGVLSHNFTAWLSTSSSDTIARIGSFAGCVENVFGQLLAGTFSAFRSASLLRDPSVTEAGMTVNSKVFTSTRRDGSFVAGDGDACRSWTSASSNSKAIYGSTDETGSSWSADGTSTDTCDKQYAIYCLGLPTISTANRTSLTPVSTASVLEVAPTPAPVPFSTLASVSPASVARPMPVSTPVPTLAPIVSTFFAATIDSAGTPTAGQSWSPSARDDWWIYVVVVIIALLLACSIVGFVLWRKKRASTTGVQRKGTGDEFFSVPARTNEYASASSLIASPTPTIVYGKAPTIDRVIVYDVAL